MHSVGVFMGVLAQVICKAWHLPGLNYRDFRWLTVSKALLKSCRIRSVYMPFMRDLVRSSTSSISGVSQVLRSRKPCCKSYSMLYLLKCLIKLEAIMSRDMSKPIK